MSKIADIPKVDLNDTKSNILDDIITPLQTVHMYYLSKLKDREIARENSTTILTATDHKEIKIMLSKSLDTELGFSNFSNNKGQTIKNWKTWSGLTNDLPDKLEYPVAVFTIGEELDIKKFQENNQTVYISNSMIPAGAYDTDGEVPNVDESLPLTEITFISIERLLQNFKNSKIIFTRNEQFSENVLTFNGDSGITIGFENHTLVSFLQAKGTITELNGVAEIGTEEGEIELISKEKWTPFKATPIEADEKVNLFMDWFDYDSVLPYVYANLFKTGDAITAMIKNSDDQKLVEDMLALSAGFASNWDTAPVLTTGNDAGKIDPTFRVGNSGIKISVIANSDPQKVIDGVYENHIRKFPAFSTDYTRYQPVRSFLNAMSRYIYSNYAISKGQNSYNMAYLPWYLEASSATPINFNKKIAISNPDKGGTGSVDTFVIDDGIKYLSKTLYFNDNFTDDVPVLGTNDLKIPNEINFSSNKLVQTDRKLTLPKVPKRINSINKLPLPGDVDSESSADLSYLFFIPLSDQQLFQNLYLSDLNGHTTITPGTEITVSIPRTIDGTIWTLQEANAFALSKQPGTIKTESTLSFPESPTKHGVFSINNDVTSSTSLLNADLYFENPSIQDLLGFYKFTGRLMSEAEQIDTIQKRFNIRDRNSIVVHSSGVDLPKDNGDWWYTLKHTEFTPTIITSANTVSKTFSYQRREIVFDKQQWSDFLSKFGIIPDGISRYSFKTRDNWRMDKIDEIQIGSLWANKIDLYFGTHSKDFIEVPIFNKQDESITTEYILIR